MVSHVLSRLETRLELASGEDGEAPAVHVELGLANFRHEPGKYRGAGGNADLAADTVDTVIG